jgi:hypothetical protein
MSRAEESIGACGRPKETVSCIQGSGGAASLIFEFADEEGTGSE